MTRTADTRSETDVAGEGAYAPLTTIDATICDGFRGGDFQPDRGRYGNWTQKSTRTVTFKTTERERQTAQPHYNHGCLPSWGSLSWRAITRQRIAAAHKRMYGLSSVEPVAGNWDAVY